MNEQGDAMKYLLRLLVALMMGSAYAQSKLPACPSYGYFHNCFGTHTLASGSKYIGEFKDGKPFQTRLAHVTIGISALKSRMVNIPKS